MQKMTSLRRGRSAPPASLTEALLPTREVSVEYIQLDDITAREEPEASTAIEEQEEVSHETSKFSLPLLTLGAALRNEVSILRDFIIF